MQEDDEGLGKTGFGGRDPLEGPSKAGFLGSKKGEAEGEEESELEDRVGCKGDLRRPGWEGDPVLSVWAPAV